MKSLVFCLFALFASTGARAKEREKIPVTRMYVAEVAILDVSAVAGMQPRAMLSDRDWAEVASSDNAVSTLTSLLGDSSAVGGSRSQSTYLCRDTKSTFHVEQLEPAIDLGQRLELIIEEKNGFKAKLKFSESLVVGTDGGAMAIAGVRVPIGKPTIKEFSEEWDLDVRRGQVYVVDVPVRAGSRKRIAFRFDIEHIKVPGQGNGELLAGNLSKRR